MATTDRPIHVRRARKNDENPYVQILRTTAQDETLSWEARGVLTYLLSKPDTWVLQPSDLKQGCGRDKVYAIINELIEARYIARTIERDALGRMTACYYDINESPMTLETVSTGGSAPFPDLPDTDSPDTAQPDPAKPDSRYKRLLDKKEEDSLATFVSGEPTLVRDSDIEPDSGIIEASEPIRVVSENNGQLSFATPTANDLEVEQSSPPQPSSPSPRKPSKDTPLKRAIAKHVLKFPDGVMTDEMGSQVGRICKQITKQEKQSRGIEEISPELYQELAENILDAKAWERRTYPDQRPSQQGFAMYYAQWIAAGRPARQVKPQPQYTLGFAEPQQRWIPGVGMVLDKLSGGYEIIEPVAKIEREAKGA